MRSIEQLKKEELKIATSWIPGEKENRIILWKPENLKDELSKAKECLNGDGTIYLFMDNSLGLNNLERAGVLDEDKPRISGMTRSEIVSVLKDLDLSYKEYYPYPSLEHMRVLFSEERMPAEGELLNYRLDNLAVSNIKLFDEIALWNGVISEGAFPSFSNAYIFVIGKAPDVIYAKFSSDRDQRFRICTEIVKTSEGKKIKKMPLCEEAKTHVAKLNRIQIALRERFKDLDVSVVECIPDGDAMISPFVKGNTLAVLLEECISVGNKTESEKLLNRFKELIYAGSETKEFVPSDEFCKVFGNVSFSRPMQVARVSDLDLNFDNIIVNDTWNLIDYEWSFDFEIPQTYILYRSLLYWSVAYGEKLGKSLEEWFSCFDISPGDVATFNEMEQSFQRYVYGDSDAYFRVADLYRKPEYTMEDVRHAAVKINFFFEGGEKLTYYWLNTAKKEFHYTIPIPENTRQVKMEIDCDYLEAVVESDVYEKRECIFSKEKNYVIMNVSGSRKYIRVKITEKPRVEWKRFSTIESPLEDIIENSVKNKIKRLVRKGMRK